MAGAPGFEPGMSVPKTDALPLGDAPAADMRQLRAALYDEPIESSMLEIATIRPDPLFTAGWSQARGY
jgi:hypothetical protein